MKKVFLLLFLLIIVISISSCKKDIEEPLDIGYDYFPVSIGKWAIYEVDSTYYNDFTDSVYHYNYKIKELIESTFLDNQNRETQRLERYKKISDTTDWYISNVWALNLTATTAEKVEEDYRFVKLIFPVKKSSTWDGNAYNILDEQEYKYTDVHKSYNVNGITYDSTITVIQKIVSNPIQEDYQIEVFAKHIGMIYKKYISLKKSNAGTVIDSGNDYTYSIISYGN